MEIVFHTNKKLKGFWGIQDAENVGINKPNIGTIKKKVNVNISETETGTMYLLNFTTHSFLHPRQNEHTIIKNFDSAKRGEFTTTCIAFPTLSEARAFARKIVNVPSPLNGKLANGKTQIEELGKGDTL